MIELLRQAGRRLDLPEDEPYTVYDPLIRWTHLYAPRPPPAMDLRDRPSAYLLPREDRTFTPSWMRQLATERLGVDPVELPGGHCPHVSRPDDLADILLGLAS